MNDSCSKIIDDNQFLDCLDIESKKHTESIKDFQEFVILMRRKMIETLTTDK